MIIVEGPDGSGKSTIAQVLSALTGREVHHNGGPPDSVEATRRIEEMFRRPDRVFERATPISELVYGVAIRKVTVLPQFQLYLAIAKMIEMGAIFVYCRPRDGVLYRSLVEGLSRKKEWKSAEHCERVQQNYKRILAQYDFLFGQITRAGGMVLNYQWEPEDVRTKLPL